MQTSNASRHSAHRAPVLWIVDSEQWPRACLRAELIERGYDAYGFISLSDAIDALSRQKPDAFVLELRDQTLTKEMLEVIRGLNIPTILLGGSAELNSPLVLEFHWTRTLKRPFTLGAIADVVQELVSSTG